jgi:hypothetical protein
MSKIQYEIQMKDLNHKDTFETKFYIEPDVNYIKILEQFIEELKKYNLEINSSNLEMITIGNSNPKEQFIILQRVNHD